MGFLDNILSVSITTPLNAECIVSRWMIFRKVSLALGDGKSRTVRNNLNIVKIII